MATVPTEAAPLRAQIPRTEAATLRIVGADIDAERLRLARVHSDHAGTADAIEWHAWDACRPPAECTTWGRRGHIVTNPPFGMRLADKDGVRELFRDWGDALRRLHRGWNLTLLCPDGRLLTNLRLDLNEVAAMRLGGTRVGVWSGRIR